MNSAASRIQKEADRLGKIQEKVRREFNPDYPRNATPKCDLRPGESLQQWINRKTWEDGARDRFELKKRFYRSDEDHERTE